MRILYEKLPEKDVVGNIMILVGIYYEFFLAANYGACKRKSDSDKGYYLFRI